MTDQAPAVALLFDDTELGSQLRAALTERGARIVHEGKVSSLDRELLQRVGAGVLVVNLDDSADDALDSLYELLDGDRPRVVFNDAQASRALEGWDRARWARHLAVKVLSAGDIDPPRPHDARGIAPVAVDDGAEVAPPVGVTHDDEPFQSEPPSSVFHVPAPAETAPEHEASIEPLEPDFIAHEGIDGVHGKDAAEASESLAAELEALLASGELPAEEEETGPGLRYVGDEEPPPLHDGDFGVPVQDEAHAAHDDVTVHVESSMPLQLASQEDPLLATIPASADAPFPSEPVATPVSAPLAWALLDDDAAPAADAVVKVDASMFGIEKVSAADYLAPEADTAGSEIEPTFSLELVSLEEAMAPQPFEHSHEMLLDELGSALSRIVLLGAASSGLDSVCAFLAGLPADSRATLLHTQHLREGQSDQSTVERLAAHSALPVRLAAHGALAVSGEVLVVPNGQHVLLRRDGRIELQGLGVEEGAQVASIDMSFTMAANAFGRDAVAIVFAGRANDAVAGSQAVHDRGGQVWVESSSGEHFADMVSSIFAERLVSFSGTPSELAAHLIEVFP